VLVGVKLARTGVSVGVKLASTGLLVAVKLASGVLVAVKLASGVLVGVKLARTAVSVGVELASTGVSVGVKLASTGVSVGVCVTSITVEVGVMGWAWNMVTVALGATVGLSLPPALKVTVGIRGGVAVGEGIETLTLVTVCSIVCVTWGGWLRTNEGVGDNQKLIVTAKNASKKAAIPIKTRIVVSAGKEIGLPRQRNESL
jgi:hypothetical protein